MNSIVLSVPVIDIGSIKDLKDNQLVSSMNEEIHLACQQWGFFYIKNHNISKQLIHDTVDQARALFSLSKEEKRSIARYEGNFQGYADNELTQQKLDLKEIFDWSSEGGDSQGGIEMHGNNQWPTQLPLFRTTIMNYFMVMQDLSRTLMEVMFQQLIPSKEGVGANEFVESCFAQGGNTSFGRLNYYPVHCSEVDNDKSQALGVGPHSDAGILTILYQQEGVTSLQVLNDGTFYNVPPIPGTFVVNIGDMTEVFSNGRFKAPIHRVLANPSCSRISIPFFCNPSYSCIVEPLPSCITLDNPKQFNAIKWGEFRLGRILGDYADYGEELQTSHYRINKNKSSS